MPGAHTEFDDRVASTLDWLRSIDPRLTAVQRLEDRYVSLELPRPPSAEYCFRLLFFEDEFSLTAIPICDPEAEAFWHQNFERLGAASLEPVERAFREFVADVISQETRITQRRGLFFHRFTCEVFRGSGWERVGGRVLALRAQFRAPRISGRTRHYRSPALVAANP